MPPIARSPRGRSSDARHWCGRRCSLAGVAGLSVLAGFVAFAGIRRRATPPADPRAEGIVVLTGGSARIDSALRLLAEGRASRLLISGVNPAVSREALAEHLSAPNSARCSPAASISGTPRATPSATPSRRRHWAEQQGFASLLVVTSDYHMPRSMAELADAMPDVALFAYPITNPELHLADWWSDPRRSRLLVREYGKYLLDRGAPDALAAAPRAARRPGG